jgi:hypothetical protein
MKRKYILPILFISLLSLSCSTDNDDNLEVNEIEGLIEVKVLSNDTHNIEIYNTEGQFTTGYNALSIRIKDKLTNSFVENASLSWMPIMQMPTMQHSCPKSAIIKAQGKDTVFEGYIIYQMTNPDGSGWSLTINYTIDEVDYSVTDTITVLQNSMQNVTSFMGSDNLRYIIALIKPNDPIIGINDMMVGLYKMENMMSFPVVEDYTIMLDPRMPGMGNHGSPNNTDLTFNFSDKMYHGNLSLTMTGYWVLNLKLMSDQDELLKGEDVSESNIQSSLYLELEF